MFKLDQAWSAFNSGGSHASQHLLFHSYDILIRNIILRGFISIILFLFQANVCQLQAIILNSLHAIHIPFVMWLESFHFIFITFWCFYYGSLDLHIWNQACVGVKGEPNHRRRKKITSNGLTVNRSEDISIRSFSFSSISLLLK